MKVANLTELLALVPHIRWIVKGVYGFKIQKA